MNATYTDEQAEEKAREVMAAEGPLIYQTLRQAVQLAQSKLPLAIKGEGIIDLAERVSRAITPHLACKDGCSHCCYMATALSKFEADMIGRYIGRTPEKVSNEATFGLREDMVVKYNGVPCTFLKEGRCSIYPVRPVACRTHHNLAPTSENCKIKDVGVGRQQCTPALNLTPLLMAHAQIFLHIEFADIREFFP